MRSVERGRERSLRLQVVLRLGLLDLHVVAERVICDLQSSLGEGRVRLGASAERAGQRKGRRGEYEVAGLLLGGGKVVANGADIPANLLDLALEVAGLGALLLLRALGGSGR